MGLGGHLTWTAACHEIHKATGKRCVLGKQYPTGFFPESCQIFHNNPSLAATVKWGPHGPLDNLLIALNDPIANYCKQDTPERAVHRFDKHIILQILERHGLPQVKLEDVKCRLYLDHAEQREVDRLVESIGEPFVAIEPHSNHEYTVNREYPFDKWQRVVDELSPSIKVVQVGVSQKKLHNVIDVVGRTTFRTCAGLIGRSRMLLSTEGGLTHAATAFDTPSLVVITGYQHPDMVAYPRNENLWVHGDHGPCGMKAPCPECWKHACAHDPSEIVERVKRRLGL